MPNWVETWGPGSEVQGITCCEATSVDHGTRTPEVQCPLAASVTSEARMDAAVTAAAQPPDLHVSRAVPAAPASLRGMC